MKKVNDILTHLRYSPEFKKINTNEKLDRLIQALPLKLKKGVKFAYVKKQILFFVLTHPVYKMEFEYNKEIIKSLLKKASIENVEEIRFFVTNKLEKKEIKIVEEPSFQERSYGIFENRISDEKLRRKFEEIRVIINKT
mgnify:CR=1 FL=1